MLLHAYDAPVPTTLRGWRKRLGLTQRELASLLRVTVRTIQYWEAGKRTPPPFLVRALRDIEREVAEWRREVKS